jgi:hypothetical protein
MVRTASARVHLDGDDTVGGGAVEYEFETGLVPSRYSQPGGTHEDRTRHLRRMVEDIGIGMMGATSFSLTFDASTASAPAAFFTAFNNEILEFESIYPDPITLNLHVGWGEINGGPLDPGNIGQSLTNQQAVPYAALKAALGADAKTADDATAVAHLPLANPTPGKNFAMSNAEAKALGLLAGNAPGIDGWVGFDKTGSIPLIQTIARSPARMTSSALRTTKSRR